MLVKQENVLVKLKQVGLIIRNYFLALTRNGKIFSVISFHYVPMEASVDIYFYHRFFMNTAADG